MLKKSCYLLAALLGTVLFAHARTATDTAVINRTVFIKSQTVKADSLNDLALKLASNGSPDDLNRAIDHIMAGLHIYSKFRDSVGLRQTFDNLGLVYHLQKKYVQAKWFILQSNEISREKRDTLNIIASLLTLASVKEDIKDFSLAESDLDEALSLAKTLPRVNQQIEVQKAFAQYYTKQGDMPGATMSLNRIKFLHDSAAMELAAATNTSNQKVKGSTMVNKDASQQKRAIITIITLIAAALAAVSMMLYRRRKNKK